MRMWKINPQKMCDKHLLGEHAEMHMFVGTLNKGIRIQGYIDGGLVEVENIISRHKKLAKEMQNRGFKHKSPLPDFEEYRAGTIDVEKNIEDLVNRCSDCRLRHPQTIKSNTCSKHYD